MKSLSLDKPHAILMVGIRGSGKTFFARKFADTFNAPYIEQSALLPLAYDNQATDQLVKLFIQEITKTKQSLVLEVDTSTRIKRSELARELKTAGYTPLFIWVQVDAETAQLRSKKNHGLSADDHADQVRRFAAPHASERALVISGKHTYATQARIILKKLSAPRLNTAPTPRPVATRGQIIVR